MGALKRATKREREKWEQSSKPKNLGQKKKNTTLTLNSQLTQARFVTKREREVGEKRPKEEEKWGLSKGPQREREKWEQSSKPKNLGQKKKTHHTHSQLSTHSSALCDKKRERSG